VLSQKPRAYSKIKKGRRIHVVVSKGSELLTVPNITRGISLRTAEIELKSVGFELGSVTHQSSEDIPKGVVLSQSPSPNTVAPRGTFVNVTVSRGPKTGLTIVPELIGLSTESAVVELKEAGLTVGTIEYVEEADILPETVVRQSIEAGEEVDRGTLVDITVTE
jgi:serine/threonine-protein kinase